MEKLLLLFCFITVLFTQKNIDAYADQPVASGCAINPYDNLLSGAMEYWDGIEDLSPLVCAAFVGVSTYTVEYTVLPSATQWTQVTLNNSAQLCDVNGDFTFEGDLLSVAKRHCGETLAMIITPYCANGENGVPVVMSFIVACNSTSSREGTNILARIEDLITEIRQNGDEVISGTSCAPDDIDCIKNNINTVINPNSVPSTLQSFTSKKETSNGSASMTIDFFPNPASDIINFNLEQHTLIGVERASLIITDAQGRKMNAYSFEEGSQHSLQIDLSDWVSGMYFYRFSIDDKVHFGKIIKR